MFLSDNIVSDVFKNGIHNFSGHSESHEKERGRERVTEKKNHSEFYAKIVQYNTLLLTSFCGYK